MTPQKRSTLQLDFKDLNRKPAWNTKRVMAVCGLGAGTLCCAYLLVGMANYSDSALVDVQPQQPSLISTSAVTETVVQEMSAEESNLVEHAVEVVTQRNPESSTSQTTYNVTENVQTEDVNTKQDQNLLTSDNTDNNVDINTGIDNIERIADTNLITLTSSKDSHEVGVEVDTAVLSNAKQTVNEGPVSSISAKVSLISRATAQEFDPVQNVATELETSEIAPIDQDFLPGLSFEQQHQSSDQNQAAVIQLASIQQPVDKPIQFSRPKEQPSKAERKTESKLDENNGEFTPALVPDSIEGDLNKSKDTIDPIEWITASVRKKDTLSEIFGRHNLSMRTAIEIAEMEEAAPLLKIRPGQNIFLHIEQEELQALKYQIDTFDTLLITKNDTGYEANISTREPEVKTRSKKATINSSLLAAAGNSDISYNVVYELISLFGWQVDFAKDIQRGDEFSIIYEEHFLDGEKVADGEILAAELVTGSKSLRAVRHVDEDGYVDYFAPDGDGIKGSFLRTPIKFGRVTSNFSKRRYHPILKEWRAHKGVDYGAPMKTPVFSTGDGVIRFAGAKKGYGRTVIIRHGGKFQTLYAHLNHFAKGIKSGSRVKQGDVIGYVGKTGWATGPHLHYEFQVNGVHKNPLTVTLPKSAPIDKKYLKDFKKVASNWSAELDKLNTLFVAQKESNNSQL